MVKVDDAVDCFSSDCCYFYTIKKKHRVRTDRHGGIGTNDST